MHNADTLKNLQASLEAPKQIMDAQRAEIRVVGYERDLLAVGYQQAMQKRAELEISARAPALIN